MIKIRKLEISGRSCVHCEKTLTEALVKISGVSTMFSIIK